MKNDHGKISCELITFQVTTTVTGTARGSSRHITMNACINPGM